ncbi:predicted protein [Uncinocarpus reesii 1704]|uniref:Carrier domain-containing protein n=1 Tax=Uncinocarpus reesii (strain UAMH 1704) TaxID=336963 RepID=C4JQC3_UNCRE|nr:uncharacterized protein UREG_04677 [Uncinocarpus reesii 1704]EEP79831.1 predicted protein [Uncinocarpus reesii 1704]
MATNAGLAHNAAKHWQNHLAGLTPCQFPRLGAKSHQRTKRPMTVRMNLRESQKLQDLAVSGGAALPTVLRAVWALVLRCYTDSEDVCFGYQEIGSGAIHSEVNATKGLFGVPIARLQLNGDATLGELIELAQGEYSQCLPYHGHAPFARSSEHQPFNTMLVFRTSNVGASSDASVNSRPFNAILPEECRIRILAKQLNGTISMFMEWWSSDMTMDQALDVASTFDRVLNIMFCSPQVRIENIDWFTDRHMKRILKWNNKPLEKVEKCIHEVFQAQAVRRADSEAICAWDGSFTYAEFDRVTSRLANHLVEMGVGPEVRVPCCFDKSKWYAVATFAILKAGGAFVPLDPAHPIPRLQSLIHKLEAKILLSSTHHAGRLLETTEKIISVDQELIDNLASLPTQDNYVPRCRPGNAAYLIFTSGSTGEPKGTVVEHAAYVSGAKAHAPALSISEESRSLQFAAHTFDASLVEMVTPLLVGGTVCIPSEEARMNDIVGAINEMQVNLAVLTPSFVNFVEPAQVPGLKVLVLAGEAMSQSHVDIWSQITLINGYGPTESSVSAVTNSHVTAATDPKDIGFPTGLHCWVVNPDDHHQLLPPGCTGELLLEGPSLAREYLANPEKTSDAFINRPIWAKQNNGECRRFYKTGDLVRYNSPEGSFDYVGRKDTQIKFHGQRIELGEIEHHVAADPNVNHGLVLFPKNGRCKGHIVSIFTLADHLVSKVPSDPKLLGLVARDVRHTPVEAIRQRLTANLPSYMVPSIWLCVEMLPMLSSRKLDRKAVSKWVDEIDDEFYLQVAPAENAGDDSEEPANEVEGKLRMVWSRVLNLPINRVGLSQSFLSLGGDSITAMTCMGQCKKAGLGFTVQEVLRSKSIRDLAVLARTNIQTVDYQEEVEQLFDLTPIQQYHFQVRREDQGHFNQSFFLRLAKPTTEETLRQAVHAIVDRHSMLRARFSQTADGNWKQRITCDVASSYQLRIHQCRSRDQAESMVGDSQRSINAENGPLFTADLFDIDGKEQLLSVIGHHLVIDLVSWRVILEDLEELLLDPQSPSLASKSIPFQTWSKLQIDHCQDLDLSKVISTEDIPSGNFAYWNIDPRLNTYGDSACEGFEIDAPTTSTLLTDCHDVLRTESLDILLAALIHSFADTFHDRVVPAIYNEGHGREPWDDSIDISRTVGWFTTVYPVFVPTLASDNIVDTVMRVKDIRRRVPGNGRPYFASRFHTEGGKDKFRHHAPMEVSFNYLGQYQQLERKDALLQPVDEMAGEAREAGGSADYDKTTPRFGLFEISAVIACGKLRFAFTFNRHMRHQSAIRQWVSQCQRNLQLIAEQFVAMAPKITLSDFPLLPLTYDNLDSMITEKLPQIGISSFDQVEDVCPCSPMQQGLLLSKTKDGAFYSVHGTFEVKPQDRDRVDADRLASAWLKVVAHHPALRTVFIEGLTSDGLYNQVVLKSVSAELIRLQCKSENDVLHTLQKQESFDYKVSKPPHRFTVCQTSNGKVFCRIELSHAIMDGMSISIIFRDLELAYAGKLATEPATPYSAFIGYLQTQPIAAGISFWSSYLKGVEPCHFPVLNDGMTAEKILRTLRLEYKHLSDLQSFCDSNGLTLSNAINTAWALTLRSYIGSEEACFGYLSSGRDAPIPGIDNAVGPFINMLACRVNMPVNVTLNKLLDDVQKDYMDSIPHKHTSLAEVQHSLKLSDVALFNTCVSYRRLPPRKNAKRQEIEFSEHCPIHDPTEYPVSLNIEVSDVQVAIDLDYWTDSVSDQQAKNIANNFIRSLENITYNAQQLIGELDNVSAKNYEMIWSWNSKIPQCINECIHEVVGKQAKARPEAPAICAWDGEFTYRELDEISTLLANYFAALGVVPGSFVPICFDKSAWTVISMLGVLKAGGACVPLDATHPKNALEYKVMDCDAQMVVASPQRAAMFEDMVSYVVAVNADLVDQIAEYDEFYGTAAEPTDPCFIIFTSGSTGKPKGVVLEHRSIVSSAEAHGSALGFGPDTRVLQFAAYTFDNSLEEMFTTLMRGGCVCVPSEEDRFNNLAGAINKLNATFMDLTPTVASFLQPADVPSIKEIGIGGEAMTKAVKDIWRSIPIHNQYGPSECSINCTHNPHSATSGDVSNIGKSTGSVSWIVDPVDHNKLVPIGAVGELLVEGPIVSRGYLNDPEKTAKSFIENPSWVAKDPNRRAESTRRMYKTGDLVRYDSDGSIVYLGRKDTQVKLNGQRIELGEIEHHVKTNLPDSTQSAVHLITSGGIKALAVFMCMSTSSTTTTTDSDDLLLPMTESIRSIVRALESALSAAIPTYMVPSAYIPVTKMPLTASGKLDRRALSHLALSMSDEQASTYRLGGMGGGREPATQTEKLLQDLWASILSKPAEAIGADDSFFRHGGDSIGAMKLVSAARSKGLVLSVAAIFQKPKLSDMAADCESSIHPAANSEPQSAAEREPIKPFALLPKDVSIVPLIDEVASICGVESKSVQDIYPCTSIQGGLIALSSKQPGAYVAQNVFRLASDIDINKFRKAWQAIADVDAVLRTRIVFTEELGFLQVVVNEPADWKSVKTIHEIQNEDRHLPIHDGGALSRYIIVGEGSKSPQFVWIVHHALYDGWSIPTLLDRVAACYGNPNLSATAVEAPFAKFIEYLNSIDTKVSDDFWRARLDDPTSAPWPRLPRPQYQVNTSEKIARLIPIPPLLDREITVASIIRAAWALVVSLYSYSDDVIFGEMLTGRDAPVPGIEDMIGPTFTSIPSRIRINRELTVAEYLKDVQNQFVQAMPYQFCGLQNIKRLGSDAAVACEFQNLLTITQDADESADGFWDMVGSGMGGSNFFSYPLNLSCTISKSEARIDTHYDPEIIPSWQVEQVLSHLETILGRLASSEHSQVKVGDMDLMHSRDLELLRELNSSGATLYDRCIHDMIFDQVQKDPNAMALDAWDGSFTFKQLDDLSTNLAHHLITLGVGADPETFVPLCFEKSAFIVISMLAVMKAGGAFAPLDPTHPISRLQEISADLSAFLVLCSSKHESLCQSISPQVLVVDMEFVKALPPPKQRLPPVPSTNPAYVMFTSGTTGKPKGILIEHRNFSSSAMAHGPVMFIRARRRVLQFASFTFDPSLLETFSSLILGACVCMPDEFVRLNEIQEFINKMNIDWAEFTPSFIHLLTPEEVPNLKTVSLVGEALSHSHVTTWADKVELINGYGPTEVSVLATVNNKITVETSPVNIGQRLDRCWIVDARNHDRLVPVGAVGELLVEGPTVARGYFKNPEKTEAAFIRNPRWAQSISPGDRRMYKTGDLVRYNGDGSMDIIYIGRKDTQTKVRGQRLEVEEVEHYLRADEAVLNCLVTVPTSGLHAKKLAAAIFPKGIAKGDSSNKLDLITSKNASSTVTAIRERLRQRLPPYMVPTRWLSFKTVPILPSGKLDRRQIIRFIEQLEEQQDSVHQASKAVEAKEIGVPPQIEIAEELRRICSHVLKVPFEEVELESSSFLHLIKKFEKAVEVAKTPTTNAVPTADIVQELRRVWSHVLKLPLEEVEPEASFLHLGGDSISAMQVMARCRSQGLGVTVQDIMQARSITELSRMVKISSGTNVRTKFETEEPRKLEEGKPFDLSPIQQLYFDYIGEARGQFNQSVLLRFTSPVKSDKITRALDDLVTIHPMLRARFQKDQNGIWRQRISGEISKSYHFRIHKSAQQHHLESLIEISQKSLNIEKGPLFAVDMFYLPSQTVQISLAIHHLIIDVVSWSIILQDLEDALSGSQLKPHSSLSFQNWCELQSKKAQEELVETVLPALDVPTADFDYWGMSNLPNLYGDVLTEEIELAAHVTTKLLAACSDSFGAEAVDVILASLLLSFCKEFPDRSMPPAVYNEGHGREPWSMDLDLSSTVGWFTTLSPICLPADASVEGAHAILDTIRWVRDSRCRTSGKGRSYFAYRFLTDDGKQRFDKHWPMEICFNYLGQMKQDEHNDAILQPVDGAGGQSINTLSDIGAEVPRLSLIEISAVITEGTLKVTFGFNKRMKRRNGILNWASACSSLLNDAARFTRRETIGPSLKGFPLLPLVYGAQTKLEEQLSEFAVPSIDAVEDAYPLSPMQQGILMSQQKDPQKYAFHFAFEVKSNQRSHRVDARRLEAAWQSVVARHSSLRTIFIPSTSSQNLMDQIVLRKVQGRTIFLKAQTAEQAFAKIEPLECSEQRTPHRFVICETFDGRLFCKIEISHAISDGTSMGLLLEDLTKAYETASSLEPGPLYSDFIQYLQETPREKGIQYWKDYLSGIEPCLLPSLANVSRSAKRQPGEYVFTISHGAELQKFCRTQGLTPANLLQLVWALVLRAYIGTDEVCFGVVSSGRNVPVNGIQEAVGAFINMMVCRLTLSSGTLVGDALQQLQSDFIRSMDYQTCSLTEVQHELGLSDASLFNTVFTFQKGSNTDSDGPMISFEHLNSTDPNEFNLSINISLIDSSLVIGFGYWSDTVSDQHVVNIANTFEHLLRELIAENGGDKLIGDIDLLGEHSCKQIRSWNSQLPKAVNKCVHELIEQQALLRPRMTMAVEGWDASFTYAELDSISSRLAAHLTGFGVGPEVYVPLCFEKSAWTIVAQIAVLKAGGAFVHVDPAHPESRLRMLINDVGADFVVCSPKYHEKASRVAKTTFVLDPKSIRKLPRSQTPPATAPQPSNPAYIIFTSGTTGRPKGTVIEHGAICTSALAHGEALLMNGSSRVLQFASYTFDASIMEILTGLIMGGCICVPSDEERMNDLPRAITKLRASWTCLTPSVLSTMKPERIPTMKVIAVGGEAMSEKIMEEWKGGPAIINAYGPTENSVVACASLKVDADGITRDENRSSIGNAVGCRGWIVDPSNYNRLVPVGAVGELVVEGRTVARGYLNNPQKTAEVFIDRPDFTAEPRFRGLFTRQSRMYRTGDLVRYNPDGTINYISRKDTQIKLNGQRIELGEIEYHCKANLPEQTQVAVDLVVPSDRAKKTLAVFFTTSGSGSHQHTLVKTDGVKSDELLVPMDDTIRAVARSLETGLGTAVPTYMIPHLFIPVSKLPWTSSGKLDRARLRNMVQDLSKETIRLFRLSGAMNKPAATSGMERKLQKMWEKALALPSGSVSTGDSFFRLGGDSLAAMQLAGAARAQGISLTFGNIFKYPILTDMARTCGALKADAEAELKPFCLLSESIPQVKKEVSELCCVPESEIHDIYPASSLQEGFITLAIKQPGAYVAQNVFRLSATVDIHKFKAAWQTVVNELDMLRTRIVHTASSNFLQVVLKEETIDWTTVSSLKAVGEKVAQLPSYNGGRLADFVLIDDKSSGSHYFVLSISHALYDGWSFPVMLKRVENAYFEKTSPPLQTSYARFIQYLTNADLVASDEFWRSNLAGISSVSFPQVPRSLTEQYSATRTISSRTEIPTQRPGDVTIPSIVRAAWALVISDHTGVDDVCFGETLTGRNINVPGIADVVGPTLTTVPTRIQIDRKGTLASYLQKVQQASAEVVPHQHVGLQRIKRLDGDTAAGCDFQNLLVVQTSHEDAHESLWHFQETDDVQNFFTYPLVLECTIGDNYVNTTVYHKENVINSWQVQRVLDQFGSVMQQIVETLKGTNIKINDIEVVSPSDKETIAWWNRRQPILVNECIHDVFIKKANSQPDAAAVCDPNLELTYRGLQTHASQLALYLINIGVGPETLVPICLDKSAWTVVAIMGVLMAGGAFVPLDPSHPTSRHGEILQETDAKIVLCSPQYEERFFEFARHVVPIDKAFITNLPRCDSSQFLGRASPENIAYILFSPLEALDEPKEL